MFRKFVSSFCVSAFLVGASAAYGDEAMRVEPQSLQVLKAASDYIASLKSFSYSAQASLDVISSANEKLTYGTDLAVSIKRPNKVYAKKIGYENLSFYFNGSQIVGFNPKANLYSSIDQSGDIDALVKALSQHQVEAPMSDFITSDPYRVLSANLTSGRYLGVIDFSGGKYHHLAFRQENVDWQLWVDAGAVPMIKRFQVTSKSLTGSPSYTVEIKDWKSDPEISDSLFEFKASDSARLVDFKDLNPA